MSARTNRRLAWRKRAMAGHGVVELAISLPFLLLMLAGAGDFGRIFYASTSVTSAAGAGALYASHTIGNSSNTTGITNAVKNDMQDFSGVTVKSTTYCECPDTTSISCDVLFQCGAGLKKRTYAKVTVSHTFNPTPLLDIPGVPAAVTINKQVVMRVQ